jgi:hypothetical protein
MSTKRNDDKGYERGARGIDGRDGENFVSWGKAEGICKVTGSDGGPSGSKSAGEFQRSAKGK